MSSLKRRTACAIVFTLSALLSCGEDSPTDPTAQTVGPAGGVLSFDDGRVVLAFPRDALSEEIAVSVGATLDYPANPRLVPGTVYEFQPADIEFAEPVMLHVQYDPNEVPDSIYEERLRLYELADGQWLKVKGSKFNENERRAEAPLSGFSILGILGVSPTESIEGVIDAPWSYVFPGDSVGFRALTIGFFGDQMEPVTVSWSVSDSFTLRLAGDCQARCFAKGLEVGEAFLFAEIDDEYTGEARITVDDSRTPTAAGVIDSIQPPPAGYRDTIAWIVMAGAGPYSVYHVAVVDYTSIYVQSELGTLTRGTLSDVSVGDSLRAWTEFGVTVSYPPMFRACRIEIIRSGSTSPIDE